VTQGPTSPSFTITNSRGVEVWNNCDANDRAGACALYLMLVPLKPGASSSRSFTWDQRAGTPLRRVATGTYRLRVNYSGVAVRSVAFVVTASSSRTIAIGVAQSGAIVSLRIGDRLAVSLVGPSIYTWSEPVASNRVALVRLIGTSGATSSATFIGAVKGLARVSAVDNPNCYPACLPPSRLFTITVHVTG
jgi:hypothetical protein